MLQGKRIGTVTADKTGARGWRETRVIARVTMVQAATTAAALVTATGVQETSAGPRRPKRHRGASS